MPISTRLHDVASCYHGNFAALENGALYFDGQTLAMRAMANQYVLTAPLSGADALLVDRSVEGAGGVATFSSSLRVRAVPLSAGFTRRGRPADMHGALLFTDRGLAFAYSYSGGRDDERGAGALTLRGDAARHLDQFLLGFTSWRLEWLNEHGEVVLDLESVPEAK